MQSCSVMLHVVATRDSMIIEIHDYICHVQCVAKSINIFCFNYVF